MPIIIKNSNTNKKKHNTKFTAYYNCKHLTLKEFNDNDVSTLSFEIKFCKLSHSCLNWFYKNVCQINNSSINR